MTLTEARNHITSITPPPGAEGHVKVLRGQIKNFEGANDEERTALKPAIADTIKRIEKVMRGGHGRTLKFQREK